MNSQERLSRRQLLQIAGAVGVGGAAAACTVAPPVAPVSEEAVAATPPAAEEAVAATPPPADRPEVELIRQRIQENFDQFLSDPEYKEGIDELDIDRVHDGFESIKQDYATFMAFYVYRREMKALKAPEGALADEMEDALVERGNRALAAYTAIVDSLVEINDMWYSTSVGPAMDRHAKSVFQYLDYNPKTPSIIDEFREMGVPEGSICWLFGQMMENDYDILRLEGMDGTFSNVVEQAASLAPRLEESVLAMKRHGLPTIEGAGKDKDEYVEAGVAVGLAIIVGLFFGFCYDWRPLSLPHVRHWNS